MRSTRAATSQPVRSGVTFTIKRSGTRCISNARESSCRVPADAVVTAIEDKTRRAASPRIMLSSTITTRTSRLRSPAILTGCALSSKSPEARMTRALVVAELPQRRPVTRLTEPSCRRVDPAHELERGAVGSTSLTNEQSQYHCAFTAQPSGSLAFFAYPKLLRGVGSGRDLITRRGYRGSQSAASLCEIS